MPAPAPQHRQRERGQRGENPRWPAAPPWSETRAEFEARVAEYDRREVILARHNIHVVYREVDTGFQLRLDGRPGIWVADRQSAYLCDERGLPVRFDQASYAIEHAWEHLLPPEARVSAGSDGPRANGSQAAAGDGC